MQMVNGGFPEPALYGFESVDAGRASDFTARIGHQSKIYTESNESEFSRIFGALSSMQTLAIYRRLLVRGLIARTIATVDRAHRRLPRWVTTKPKETNRGREMFFLLRMAFWLGLVLVLLPREKTPESDKLPQVGASEAVSAATAAVSDMSQFCKRQPAACDVGGQAATVIGQRAQEGARKLHHIITDKTDKKAADKKTPDHTGSIGGADDADGTLPEAASRDTLTPDDMVAEWRGQP
jgi:hypothetical protein